MDGLPSYCFMTLAKLVEPLLREKSELSLIHVIHPTNHFFLTPLLLDFLLARS